MIRNLAAGCEAKERLRIRWKRCLKSRAGGRGLRAGGQSCLSLLFAFLLQHPGIGKVRFHFGTSRVPAGGTVRCRPLRPAFHVCSYALNLARAGGTHHRETHDGACPQPYPGG
jgi:hypothetical protein